MDERAIRETDAESGTAREIETEVERERQALLERLQEWLEKPMLVLAFVWLGLFVVEVVWGVARWLEIAGLVIWGVFIVEFAISFTLAPRKLAYLRSNWLKAIALLAPALRTVRLLHVLKLARLSRAAGMARSLRLLRVVSSLNRGMRALAASMRRRGFGYVVALTLIVTLVGSAAMFAFEANQPGGRGLDSYGTALWWTAMLMTSMGSDYWPQTPEGRALCLMLALYGFAMFGYVTATLATFFVGRDAEHEEAEVASARSIALLRSELQALREEVRAALPSRSDPG